MRTPSEQTLREMAAGRRAVERAALPDQVKALKSAGFKVTPDMDAAAIKVNYILATGVHAVPETTETYRCGICGEYHKKGERCPNSARKHVTNIWAQQ